MFAGRIVALWLALTAALSTGCRSRSEPAPTVITPPRDAAIVAVVHADAAPVPADAALAPVEPAWFDEVEAFHDGLARVRRDQLWGYLDTAGRLVVPIAYDRLDHFESAVAWAHGADGFHIARRGKDTVSSEPIAATAVTPFVHGVAMVQDHDGWRLIAATGKDVIATRFASAQQVVDGCALWSVTAADKSCVVGPSGTCIAATSRTVTDTTRDGVTIVDEAGKVGEASCAGDVIIPPAYDDLRLMHGWAWVWTMSAPYHGMWGLADPAGRVVIPPHFRYVGDLYDDGVAFVGNVDASGKDLHGLVTQPDHVVEPIWRKLRAPSEGLVAVLGDAGWGFVTTSDEVIVKPELDEVGDFHDHLAAFRKGDKWGFLDDHGAVAIAPTYDHVRAFANGLAAVQLGTAFGMIDHAGAIVLPLEYQNAITSEHGLGEAYRGLGKPYAKGDDVCVVPPARGKPAQIRAVAFSELGELHGDRAAARDKRYCVYIDAACHPVGDQRFEYCGSFDRAGYAIVSHPVDGAYGSHVIDRDLDQVADVSAAYGEAEPARLADGIFKVQGKDDRVGVLANGAVTVPLAYDDAGLLGEGFVAVARGGKWGFFSLAGAPLVIAK